MKSDLKPRTRLAGEDRAREVVLTAYRLIASKGLEGLRTREVAAQAGINPATLHYYFPTKEDLIQGVVDYMIDQFAVPIEPEEEPKNAADAIRNEFKDLAIRAHRSKETFVVLAELSLRAHRDPEIAKILDGMRRRWKEHVVGLIEKGIEDGEFRAGLDLDQAADDVMFQLRSISIQPLLTTSSLDRYASAIADQTLSWLLPEKG